MHIFSQNGLSAIVNYINILWCDGSKTMNQQIMSILKTELMSAFMAYESACSYKFVKIQWSSSNLPAAGSNNKDYYTIHLPISFWHRFRREIMIDCLLECLLEWSTEAAAMMLMFYNIFHFLIHKIK